MRLADEVGHERVAALVVGEDPLLLLGDDAALLEAGDDPLDRRVEVGLFGSRARSARPAKIAASLQMFARSAPVSPAVWRAIEVEVDVVGERLPARVDGEDRLAAGEVGRGDEDLPVEAARAQKRGVEVLEPVRGADDDDLRRAAEAVELDEQLVERLVLLAVEAGARCGACRRRRARR